MQEQLMKAQLTRKGESDIVTVHFNAKSVRVLQSRNFNIEESPEGLLITFPQVDDHNAQKISSHGRDIEVTVIEDFKDGWHDVKKLSSKEYLIPVDFE